MAFENESLEADNRRYSAEVTDLAGENSALLADNAELRAQGDELLAEVRNMRRALAVGRTDLLYLKLKLKAFEMRFSEEGDDGDLQEDIEEWKRNWREVKRMGDGDAVEAARSGSEDTRSTISLGDGSQLVITRAASSRPSAPLTARSASVSMTRIEPVAEVDEDAVDPEYEEEADDEQEDETSPDSETADDETAENETATQEQDDEDPALEEAGKTPWERLWDDLAAFAGVHD
jgi:hypothetical protein